MNYIVHPTLNCNASCSHCGVSLPSHHLNPEELLKCIKYIKSTPLNTNGNKDLYIFHGGEPMLVGPEYYEKFINDISKESDVEISYAMQSNMTLYDNRWKNLINKYNIQVSSSYDFFTNYRKLKNNQSYYSVWVNNIKKYQDDTNKRMAVITVIGKNNYPYIEDIIDIANELNIDIKLNPLYNSGHAKDIFNDLSLTPEEYADVLIRAYRRWQNYRNRILFYQGKIFEDFIFNQTPLPCPYNRNCKNSIIAILPNGDIYKCGICSQLQLNCVGNALNETIDSKNFNLINLHSSIVPEKCLSCDIFDFCQGGCFIDYKNNRISSEKMYYCHSIKTFYYFVKAFNY